MKKKKKKKKSGDRKKEKYRKRSKCSHGNPAGASLKKERVSNKLERHSCSECGMNKLVRI